MENLFNTLIDIISKSIEAIESTYFNFPVAGIDGSNEIARERVYCSELYHQIRIRIGGFPYTVNTEPNKTGHKVIEKQCGAIDPDLIIHKPGFMEKDSNLAIIEVKRSCGDLTEGLIKDLKTIKCMTTISNGYFGGIIIVFGELTSQKRTNLINRIKEKKSEDTKKLVLILHSKINTKPEIIEI